ncbi:hypothetical protein AB1E18_003569 [Capra hircus]
MTGGRLLTGGIPGEAAVWGCSRPSTAPSVFPPPPPAAAAAALGSGNLRLHRGKPSGWCSPESGAWCPGGAAPPRAEAAKGVVCTGQPREAVGTSEQAPPPVPRSRKTKKTRTSKSLTNTCLLIGRPVTCHSWTLYCSCLRKNIQEKENKEQNTQNSKRTASSIPPLIVKSPREGDDVQDDAAKLPPVNSDTYTHSTFSNN